MWFENIIILNELMKILKIFNLHNSGKFSFNVSLTVSSNKSVEFGPILLSDSFILKFIFILFTSRSLASFLN